MKNSNSEGPAVAAANGSSSELTVQAVLEEEENDDAEVEEEVEEEAVGFEGWARVFFQARGDRSAQQILPTNSSTLARESHLYVVVDPAATELRLYPDENDLRLIVDPPVDLKYFYAVQVPGSKAGAALFLKEDDRQYRRYIFRFEFRNDAVLHPPSRSRDLSVAGRISKNCQKNSNMKRVEIKTMGAFRKSEGVREMERAEEKKSYEAHTAYLKAASELIGEATGAAESFIGLVNSAWEQDPENATWRKRPNRCWGPGYEDSKSVGGVGVGGVGVGGGYDSDDFSEGSINEDDEDNDDDEDVLGQEAGEGEGGSPPAGGRSGLKKGETVEQSLRRLRT